MDKCEACGKTEYAQQGCSRVVCPCRRSWGMGNEAWDVKPDGIGESDEGGVEGSDPRTMDRLWKGCG